LKCTACSIATEAIQNNINLLSNCMDGSGPLEAELLIIGEAPGFEEDQRGEPFVGRAGEMLNECLSEAGFDRACVRITNSCRCRPTAIIEKERRGEKVRVIENRAPTGSEIMTCAEKWLDDEIKSMPHLKLIMPLGNSPLFAVWGRFKVKKPPAKAVSKITSMRGSLFFSEQYGVHILPSYHPAYILRNPNYKKYLVHDLTQAKKFLSGKKEQRNEVKYKEFRTLEDAKKLFSEIRRLKLVSWDTETTSKDHAHGEKILSFTFSVKPYTAAYLPFWEGGDIVNKSNLKNYWYEAYGLEGYNYIVGELKSIFEDPEIKKVGHNLMFDARFIAASMGIDGKPLGIKMENWHFDTMVAHFMLYENEAHDLKSLAAFYTDLGLYDSDLDEEYKKIKKVCRDISRVRESARRLLESWDALKCLDVPGFNSVREHFDLDITTKSSRDKVEVELEKLKNQDLSPLEPHYGMIPLEIIKKYSMQDADATMRLYIILRKKVEEIGEDFKNVFYHLRMPMAKRLTQAEVAGVCVDVGLIESLTAAFSSRQEELEQFICSSLRIDEINIASTIQLQAALYGPPEEGGLGLEVIETTDKGAPSTSKGTLDKLYSITKNEVLKAIIEWRHLNNMKSTFLEGMKESINPVTGRVHPNFQIARAQTQRVVCSKPNLLNIPRDDPGDPEAGQEGAKIRNIFIPDPGTGTEPVGEKKVFVDGDLSQAEIRVFAGLSGDEQLIKMLREGIDIHSYFANIVYRHNFPLDQLYRFKEDPVLKAQRSRTKNMVFGTLYGQNEYGAEKTLGIPRDEARKIIETFFQLCPKGAKWIEDTKSFARKHGYVKTPLGVRRHLEVLLDPGQDPAVVAEAERIAVNSPIQTHASDYNCIAFLEVCKELDSEGIWYEPKVIVYDSIIIECKLKDANRVRDIMHRAMTRKRPGYSVDMACEIEVVTRWSGSAIDVDRSLQENKIITVD